LPKDMKEKGSLSHIQVHLSLSDTKANAWQSQISHYFPRIVYRCW